MKYLVEVRRLLSDNAHSLEKYYITIEDPLCISGIATEIKSLLKSIGIKLKFYIPFFMEPRSSTAGITFHTDTEMYDFSFNHYNSFCYDDPLKFEGKESKSVAEKINNRKRKK